MHDSKSIALVDIDGVLRQLIASVLKVYKKYYNLESRLKVSDVTSWDMHHLLGMSVTDFVKTFFWKHAVEVMLDARAYAAYEYINKLHEFMYIHLVTAQLHACQIPTLKWLARYSIEYDALSFTDCKYNIKGNIIIEDKPLTISHLEALGEHTVITMRRPYNTHVGIIKVSDMKEFYTLCRDIYA